MKAHLKAEVMDDFRGENHNNPETYRYGDEQMSKHHFLGSKETERSTIVPFEIQNNWRLARLILAFLDQPKISPTK